MRFVLEVLNDEIFRIWDENLLAEGGAALNGVLRFWCLYRRRSDNFHDMQRRHAQQFTDLDEVIGQGGIVPAVL